MSMCTAPRQLLLNTLEERYAKYPTVESIPPQIYKYYWGEPTRFEDHAGVTKMWADMWSCTVPSVAFFTPQALGYQYLGSRKALGPTQVEILEPYGSAKEMYERYYNR